MAYCPKCGQSDLVSWILEHLQRSCKATQDDFALAGPAK